MRVTMVWWAAARAEPMALLTTRAVRSVADAAATLARYFVRWSIEAVHRFAKQSFKLENVRTLTWRRTRNLVAATSIVLGALALDGRLPGAEAIVGSGEMRRSPLAKPRV